MIGTDKQVFSESIDLRVKTNGRPKVNRELAVQLMKSDYSTRYIRKVLKCSSRTIMRIRRENNGHEELTNKIDEERLERLGLDFDEECLDAIGISFLDWLKSKGGYSYKWVFNFCERTWDQVWNKPSIFLLKEPKEKLGDQICQKWLNIFQEDEKRIRNRKKKIRFFFRFIGRHDLCDRYFTMTLSKDPEAIRELPAITNMDFPKKLDQLIGMVKESLGEEYALALRFKLVTMMRTGNRKAEKEFLGLKRDTGKSWIRFENEDRFKGKVLGKGREEWGLEWLPVTVRHDLYNLYVSRKEGEYLFDVDVNVLLKEMRKCCLALGLPPLNLHDLRKITITWFWAFGIDLSIATELNVGWKDLNTAKKHYLTINELIRRTDRALYRNAIPEWFKEGLEEYLPIF
jgi:integrase